MPLVRAYLIGPFIDPSPERRYYLAGMPVFLLSGNYYLLGLRYVRELPVFILGTLISVVFYGVLVAVLRGIALGVIGYFSQIRQATFRTVTMLGLSALTTTVLAVLYVWLYSLLPATGVTFSWQIVQPIWVISYIADVFLCTGISVYYTYSQWERNQVENDRLKRMALQHKFDTLKSDLNPHFLFNSLNSLSTLINEDTTKAERFVDDLARVYRYLLQAGKHELVTLQTEMEYTRIYANLLTIRYGASLSIEMDLKDDYLALSLPPLTIQTLVDNAIKHNIMSATKPLIIRATTTPDGRLEVKNRFQRKINRVETTRAGLANLTARYDLLGENKLVIKQEDQWFTVTVPLIDLGQGT